jgi:thioredoxin-related protein
MIDRRSFVRATTALAASTALPGYGLAATELNDDGLHVQPWFMETFLDLREDHAEAAGAGRRFAVIWEQKGCPYCKEMHEVNFAKAKISDYVKDHFGVLQLNLWGSRSVTDFDGQEMEERELARKWRVNFTPTVMFFAESAEEGKAGADLEVARMPGYFKPFHFMTMFEFVEQKAYAEDNFQRFLQNKFEELRAKGIEADVW